MYLIFIVLYFIQSDFFSFFTIAGISPNIFIIFILFLGLFTDNWFSLILALLTGITLDLVVGRTIGVTALIFCIISIVAGYFDKNFSKENKISIVIMVIGLTIVCETATYLFNAITLEIALEVGPFIKILAIEILYNVLLTLIFYKALLKTGIALERQFKQKNIFTRYF